MSRDDRHLQHIDPQIRSMLVALDRKQLELCLGDMVMACARLDQHQMPGLFVHDMAASLKSFEAMAGISDEWIKQVGRAHKCAKCKKASVPKQGRLCLGCRQPMQVAA